jgi:NADPH:quinone reductase-like Zn-dependent oxidoreductase
MIPSGDDLDELRGLLESGKLNPVVDKTYSFEEAVDALVYLSRGRARGKVVIQVK